MDAFGTHTPEPAPRDGDAPPRPLFAPGVLKGLVSHLGWLPLAAYVISRTSAGTTQPSTPSGFGLAHVARSLTRTYPPDAAERAVWYALPGLATLALTVVRDRAVREASHARDTVARLAAVATVAPLVWTAWDRWLARAGHARSWAHGFPSIPAPPPSSRAPAIAHIATFVVGHVGAVLPELSVALLAALVFLRAPGSFLARPRVQTTLRAAGWVHGLISFYVAFDALVR